MAAPDWSATPVVLAPMAGGPSTVDLAVAVAEAGGFAFLAGAYLTTDRLASDIAEFRSRSRSPFGVNVFAPSPDEPAMTTAAQAYAGRLGPWAARAGVELGVPQYDDDGFGQKVELLLRERPDVVSFSFGWPPAEAVDRLRRAGVSVWVTVNEPAEAEWAAELGVDGLVAQGWEAGGHRGGPVDTGAEQLPVRELVTALRARTGLPLLAAGGIMSGAEAAEVMALGAAAVAFGTAFLACPEAGTSAVHVHALHHLRGTTVTRAFTGRSARALRTTWTEVYGPHAPAAYPHVHHMTAPLRAYGRANGEPELVNLWAGEGHARLRALPAGELCRALGEELAAAR